MSNIFDQISMVAANFGNANVYREVLDEWLAFLGGRPGEILVIDGGSDLATQEIYWDLFRKGVIDKLQVIQSKHPENSKNTCYYQEHAAGALACKPYLFWYKIDTLPYRKGHEKWVEEAIALLDRPDVFAVSGSFNRDNRHHDVMPGWFATQHCSMNFALMKREMYMAAMEEGAGRYIASGSRGENPFGDPAGPGRFVMEGSWVRYMHNHNLFTLARYEDESWTVFHTNLTGEKLAQARRDNLARKDVKKYMNAANFSVKGDYYAYYGQPLLTPIQKIRIAFGLSPAGPFWRAVKKSVHGPNPM